MVTKVALVAALCPQGPGRGWRPSRLPVAKDFVIHACATAPRRPPDAGVRTLESSWQVAAVLRPDRGGRPCLSPLVSSLTAR